MNPTAFLPSLSLLLFKAMHASTSAEYTRLATSSQVWGNSSRPKFTTFSPPERRLLSGDGLNTTKTVFLLAFSTTVSPKWVSLPHWKGCLNIFKESLHCYITNRRAPQLPLSQKVSEHTLRRISIIYAEYFENYFAYWRFHFILLYVTR